MSWWNPFAKAERKQDALIFTSDLRIVEHEIPVDRGYLLDMKEEEGYGLDEHGMQRNKDNGHKYLILSELSAIPLYIGLPVDRSVQLKTMKSRRTEIAEENFEKTMSNVAYEENREKVAQMLQIVVIGFAITAVVLIIAVLFMSGKVSAPW